MHSHEPMFAPPKATPAQRVPAWVKFLFTIVVVLGASLCPRAHPLWLYVPAAVVLLVFPFAGVGVVALARRIVMLEPFVMGVALLALFTPGTAAERWLFFAFLMARCTIALAMMVLFAAATPFSEMLRLFRAMHVPALLVTTLALMHRYLFVLSDESGRMRRARRSRTFSPRRRLQWRTLSGVIGTLFLRANDRADRIYDAMRARGWGEE